MNIWDLETDWDKNMKQVDRNDIQRIVINDIDKRLIEIKGGSYIEYRKEFDAARSHHIRPERPIQLTIELNSWCNLRCKMCMWNYSKNPSKAYMPLEMINDIAKQAKDLKIPSIWLGAFNEITLYPYFSKSLRKFSEAAPIDYWMSTNGTLLSKEISELIIDIPLTKLSVSLDAANPETYKKIRGGNLEQVERNIYRFFEIRENKRSKLPFLRLTFVEQEENRNEYEQFVDKWKNLADIIDLQKQVDFSYMKKHINEISIPENNNFICYYPFYVVTIRHDGRFQPCCSGMYKSNNYLNINDMSISEYWGNTKTVKFADIIDKRNYAGCCKRCVASIAL